MSEDGDTEMCCNRAMAKWVQQAVLKMLRDELELDQILSDVVKKELILQVNVINFLKSIVNVQNSISFIIHQNFQIFSQNFSQFIFYRE